MFLYLTKKSALFKVLSMAEIPSDIPKSTGLPKDQPTVQKSGRFSTRFSGPTVDKVVKCGEGIKKLFELSKTPSIKLKKKIKALFSKKYRGKVEVERAAFKAAHVINLVEFAAKATVDARKLAEGGLYKPKEPSA